MKTGIVLSGGGIRGIAHLGVLQALTEAGITFHMISGTSAGSIVGALFAAGNSPQTILDVFLKTKLFKFILPWPGATGLMSLTNTGKLFLEYIPHNSFEELNIRLSVAVTNFSEGKLVYISSGKLIPVIQASSAIPGVFKPVMMDGQMYVDGGLFDNFPIKPLQKNCDFIIGSSCNHLPVVDKIVNFRKLLERAAVMTTNADVKLKAMECDVMIEPEGLGSTSDFDVKKAEEVFWLGYNAAIKKVKNDPALKQLIASKLTQ
ncbi:patatin-like phospholipase family protein [Hufsiella ginkgonis]|uniref:Patatin n=1 Tax=Hufsiella ginkgonis TaxID=2695274 RepID=A0A7K1Y2W1_9SPHI|nr:patatin-like phospholipase family protein [Hufsiella ginkgonis]MXV17600.1 patatin [Hufsiella ginkgonis]